MQKKQREADRIATEMQSRFTKPEIFKNIIISHNNSNLTAAICWLWEDHERSKLDVEPVRFNAEARILQDALKSEYQNNGYLLSDSVAWGIIRDMHDILMESDTSRVDPFYNQLDGVICKAIELDVTTFNELPPRDYSVVMVKTHEDSSHTILRMRPQAITAAMEFVRVVGDYVNYQDSDIVHEQTCFTAVIDLKVSMSADIYKLSLYSPTSI